MQSPSSRTAACSAIVVMGVSGSGKTTLANSLASALQYDVIDGDDWHLPESVEKMKNGVALEDTDRWPWLDRIGGYLAGAEQAGRGRIVACSALKVAYRDRLRSFHPDIKFIFLHGEQALIKLRLEARLGHYMPPLLLTSQLNALEMPLQRETDVLRIDIQKPSEQVTLFLVEKLKLCPSAVGSLSSLTSLTSV